MSQKIVLHEIPPSPNNRKVRIALGYKGLEYESRPVTVDEFPGDRSAIVAASCQPLTPVLQVDDTVIFDSAAILRFLEANFPQTPRIFSEDFQEMKTIEAWESFARNELGEAVGLCFQGALGGDADAGNKACELLNEASGRIEAELQEADFLVGNRLTAADITAASYVALAMMPPDAGDSPIVAYFRDNFVLGDGRDRTQAWVGRVLAHDPALRS